MGRDCCLPTAESHVEASARDAGSAAELAAVRKSDKYSALQRTHFFQSIAVTTIGPSDKYCDIL